MELSKIKPRKLKHIAEDLVRMGIKVHRYRVDVIDPALDEQLNADILALDKIRKDKDIPREEMEAAITKLDQTLRMAGGKFYPSRTWNENVEMLLVGAFLVIGIRTFFLQPFIIPTNSMYPTYNGMTDMNYVVHASNKGDDATVQTPRRPPSMPMRMIRKIVFGATNIRLRAEADGPVRITSQPVQVTGRKWLIFPARKLEYTLYVGEKPHAFRTPVDFHAIRDVLMQSLGNDREVKKGEYILNFDILTGDALFVDRFSYHFKKPKVGDPFVFKTDLVTSNKVYSVLKRDDPGKYYIKRLVGAGGDTLEIKGSMLTRDGKPSTGADAFQKNAGRVDGYPGYVLNQGPYGPTGKYLREKGDTVTIPKQHYFAMGDNSPNSSDSRTWGFVPKDAIIGKAVFIYFPFTNRWGPSH